MYLTWTCQSTLLVSSTISRYDFLNRLGPGAEARNSERSQFARRIISCLFFFQGRILNTVLSQLQTKFCSFIDLRTSITLTDLTITLKTGHLPVG